MRLTPSYPNPATKLSSPAHQLRSAHSTSGMPAQRRYSGHNCPVAASPRPLSLQFRLILTSRRERGLYDLGSILRSLPGHPSWSREQLVGITKEATPLHCPWCLPSHDQGVVLNVSAYCAHMGLQRHELLSFPCEDSGSSGMGCSIARCACFGYV